MFAVPGWAVSASSLKTQAPESHKQNSSEPPTKGDFELLQPARKKRKRSTSQNVTPANVADLWDMIIAEKPKMKKVNGTKSNIEESSQAAEASQLRRKNLREEPEKKKQEKEKPAKAQKQPQDPSQDTRDSTTVTSSHGRSSHPPPSMPLTPLQASMRQKLISARFRHLNQTLYTAPSSHALELFQQNPEMFDEYHEGFRRQVEVWPENPATSYVEMIRARSRPKGLSKVGELPLLPRTYGTCTIADLGCGQAALAQALDRDRAKLNLKIQSYDLQSPNEHVTKADIANLPLKDDSVDVAIFCLALMGTNWIDFIEEAFRVLRWKGELWVTEIKSRFGRVGRNGIVVSHSVGHKKKLDKKLQNMRDMEADNGVAEVEVDGIEDSAHKTDVSAFVGVLRKRGFVLHTDRVDLTNTMFVKLYFTKSCTPIKGKCVPLPAGMAEMGMDTWRKKTKARFWEKEDMAVSGEASVLKPCVYKTR